uniref:Transcription elongation factor, mitochondrial n=1 Tax=Pogona vitticeps TaxID=103695 RepID=A0A6J0SSI4_9SAUR
MTVKGLRCLLRTGRTCFLRVPFSTSQVLWYKKSSTTVTQGDSASTDKHFKETSCAIDDLYSSEEKSTVLHLLNSASKEELTALKLIRGRKSAKIIDHRDKHGPFQNLQSLLEVPTFQYKTTIEVCNFILKHLTKEGKAVKNQNPISIIMKYVTSEIERERLKAANSIVSVVFGTRKIAWAHVDRHLTVQDWQQQEYTMFMKGSYVPALYLEEISSVVSKFPEADFYVLEKTGFSNHNPGLFPVSLHQRTVEAMLYALLHKTFAQNGEQKVLSMPRNAVGKYFGLMVGGARASGIDLVKKFLLESLTQAEARVNFPNHQILCYRNALLVKQKRDEELCDSLLQAIAFCEFLRQDTT